MTPRLKKAEAIHDYVVGPKYVDGFTTDGDLAYVLDMGRSSTAFGRPEVLRRLRASRAANNVTWPEPYRSRPEILTYAVAGP